MANKNLKEFRNAIHQDLQIKPKGSFSINKNAKESAI